MTTSCLKPSNVDVHLVTGGDGPHGRAFRAPWLTLFTGYLCIHGLFGTFSILLDMSLLWHIRSYFFGDYDWTAPWAWADPTRYLWLCMTQILTLAAGLLLWTYPAKAKRVVITISIVLILGATLSSRPHGAGLACFWAIAFRSGGSSRRTLGDLQPHSWGDTSPTSPGISSQTLR